MKKKPVESVSSRLRLEYRSPSELATNPKNWRRHPDSQIAALTDVISEVGWAGACLYNERTDRLIDGHARQKVALTQGCKLVPVLIGDWCEADEAKILATLDPLAAQAEVDAVALAELLKEIETGSQALATMLDELAKECVIPIEIVEDDVPEPPAVAITKPGDLWLLGEHRLLCGDSTNAKDVTRVMKGERAGLMNTDPPYGVLLDQTWRDKALGAKAMGPGNDNLVANDDRADWTEAFKLFSGDVAYVWHADACHTIVSESLVNAGFDVRQQIIWNKSIMVMGRAAYHWKHEPCWFAVRKGQTANWQGDRKQTTVWDAASPNHIMSGSKEDKTNHPTQKPVELFAIPLRNHLKEGELCYDPFSGSGSQIIAAEQLNRRCFGIEISPQYCDVIVKRWETLTGKIAAIENIT